MADGNLKSEVQSAIAIPQSKGSPNVIENFYRREAPHTELRDGENALDKPAF